MCKAHLEHPLSCKVCSMESFVSKNIDLHFDFAIRREMEVIHF